MKKWTKAALGILLSFMCLFTCVGYAAISQNLVINGNVAVDPPDYDEIVITDVVACSSTTATQTVSRVPPTNVQSKITGEAGEKIVYQITAHNYSETETYVYTGPLYSDEYASVADNLTISASMDEQNVDKIPASFGLNYYEGTPVAPGEEIVFYATYELNSDISASEIMVNFNFEPVIYTITYMNGNEIYAVDCITDNSIEYIVKTEGPTNGDLVFANWINANADAVYSYSAGNTNSYTLSAKWDSVYLIMFVDESGNILYQENFKSSDTALSAEGQAIVDAKLAELAAEAAKDEMSVAWSDYNIDTATSDITVHPIYTYTGNLRFTPIDEDGDGITDYYQVDAVNKLNDHTRIPGRFNGLDVEVVNKLYLNNNNFDYGAGVNTIEIGEGIKRLNRNALAYTADLDTVKLPSTIEYIGKNVFSRNFGDDRKVLTIEFNGTMAEWQAIEKDGEWHNGLKTGSKVVCSDGYFELDRGWLGLGGYTWNAHPN